VIGKNEEQWKRKVLEDIEKRKSDEKRKRFILDNKYLNT
jgi:hypothetical protein